MEKTLTIDPRRVDENLLLAYQHMVESSDSGLREG
jgi:hypothetical protein